VFRIIIIIVAIVKTAIFFNAVDFLELLQIQGSG